MDPRWKNKKAESKNYPQTTHTVLVYQKYMKKTSLILLISSLFLSGCSFPHASDDPYAVSDFNPIQAEPSEQALDDERPLNSTLALATSADGLTYTPIEGWISDQAHLPDAVVDDEGRIFLYYTGWIVGGELDRTAVAISEDNGKTWTYKVLTVTGGESYSSPHNADIVLLPDGTFRLYYTAHTLDFTEGIHMAESQDGVHFEYKTSVFVPSESESKNSTTFLVNDTWHMYTESDEGSDAIWHLTSTDGITFGVYAKTSFPMGDEFVTPNNGIWIGDTYHLFVSTRKGEIKSWSTKNGNDWNPDDGIVLAPEHGHRFVKDPTVVELEDGSQLMIYVTDIVD